MFADHSGSIAVDLASPASTKPIGTIIDFVVYATGYFGCRRYALLEMLPGYKPCLFLSSVQGLMGIARVYNGRLLQKGSSGWMNLISVALSSHIPLGGVYKQPLLNI
jgi:hypothetical protein